MVRIGENFYEAMAITWKRGVSVDGDAEAPLEFKRGGPRYQSSASDPIKLP